MQEVTFYNSRSWTTDSKKSDDEYNKQTDENKVSAADLTMQADQQTGQSSWSCLDTEQKGWRHPIGMAGHAPRGQTGIGQKLKKEGGKGNMKIEYTKTYSELPKTKDSEQFWEPKEVKWFE